MRVLLSCALNPRFEALPDYLASALRQLGHDVTLFDHRAFLLPGRLRRLSSGLQSLDAARLNRAFERLARRLRPDLALVNQGMTLAPETIRRVRESGVRCVNWFSDYPAELEAGLLAAPAYDAFHLGSSHAARLHVRRGHTHASWLPFACDPDVHRPPHVHGELKESSPGRGARRERLVVLVGSHYPERQILLRFLRGLPIAVWGPGWERAASDPHLLPMLRGGTLRPADWVGLYGRASAVLNIHYGAFGPKEASGDLANTRVFEILATGSAQIVDRQGDVLRLFREGQDLLTFSCGDELRTRVEEALRDPDRMSAVAAAGRRAVLASHTYVHRARVLLGESPAFPLPAMQDPAPPLLCAGGER